jgi:hypothetical protein
MIRNVRLQRLTAHSRLVQRTLERPATLEAAPGFAMSSDAVPCCNSTFRLSFHPAPVQSALCIIRFAIMILAVALLQRQRVIISAQTVREDPPLSILQAEHKLGQRALILRCTQTPSPHSIVVAIRRCPHQPQLQRQWPCCSPLDAARPLLPCDNRTWAGEKDC